MNIPIGWIIAMACALGGYALHGGNIAVLWQPTEVLTIVGAAVGTMIASNNITNLKKTFAALGGAFKTKSAVKQMHLDLLCLMFEILQKIKRDGLMSLEGDIEEPESSPLFEKYPTVTKDHHLVDFITDYLRMMLGGSLDVIQIESLMEQELDVHHQEAHIPVSSVTNVADGLPAFGIVAAVMGVVHT
ncbi:MAG: motility-associated protein, partial [Polynucleobacter sp.]